MFLQNPSNQAPSRFRTRFRLRYRPPRRGAALVEFAVVAPVLLLMVCGMMEFSRAFMVMHQLNDASRHGARVAILSGTGEAAVRQAVQSIMAGAKIRGAEVVIRVNENANTPLANARAGDAVEVTVNVPYANVTWLPSSWFVKNRSLSSTTIMRRE